MEVNPSVPVMTVPEFIGYAKANPGKINMATGGVGSAPHLYGELFKAMTGVDLVTVNYRGAALALPDLIAGQDQVMFDVVLSSIGHIRAGKLRPLGVTTATRLAVLPDRLGREIAAGAWPIFDDKLAAEPLRQPLAHQARADVVRAAGGIADEDVYRPRGIALCLCDA